MEESISGFKVRGSWSDVVEHGERVTRAFRDLDVPASSYEAAFEEWEAWRPKHHEDIDDDVAPKTADQASVEEGEGEKAGKEPGDDVQSAGEKITESYERLGDGETDDAVEEWRKSIGYVARAADSAGRKALRKVEDTVYQHVMTQLAPYYFDNALVSANIQQTGGDDDTFVFEVNVNDDDLKDEVADRLYEYEDTVDRWHVDTEKDTEMAEAAEGVEPPESTTDGRSRPDQN
ncbi:hypothetical protein G9C85_18335 [Halorubellus sp. JP-L1]|uniref:DUF5828 family protein n=1 Tax=Halorubellus sp. JP-L1 TaxID=2715753 RepID=UPI00140E35C2|nr:DUF5828 family protein [Halorubellus sp. JP-L1]NHN43581.1 hypothetical protein [Halorubellus sp. JP-L1]